MGSNSRNQKNVFKKRTWSSRDPSAKMTRIGYSKLGTGFHLSYVSFYLGLDTSKSCLVSMKQNLWSPNIIFLKNIVQHLILSLFVLLYYRMHHKHEFLNTSPSPSSTKNVSQNSSECSQWPVELDKLYHDAKPFMISCTIEYSVICAAITYILWRNIGDEPARLLKTRKQNFRVDCSSSMKGMFAGLLFLVFTVVTMVIFFAKINIEKNAQAITTFHFTDILIYCISILATVFGMIRMSSLLYVPNAHNAILLDDILLIVGFIGQLMFCVFSVIAISESNKRGVAMVTLVAVLRMAQVILQTVFVLVAQRLVAGTQWLQGRKPGREVVTFLLMVNLAMFLINTFETQKAAANPMTSEFYGQSVWTVIVYSTVPLSSFYRFHSSVCLAEIWKQAYRVKNFNPN